MINLDAARFARVFGTPPIVNVHDPEAVGRELIALARDPALRARIGSTQRRWVIEHQGAHLADRVHALLADALRARAHVAP